jgi:uncharacterized protein
MTRVSLPLLDRRIEARARATREAHAYWPCAEGCDLCCRSLPHLPTIAREEWQRVWEALAALADGEREDVVARTLAAAGRQGPLTCPLLDARGACRVYDARPIACRTYGFYTERDAGLHCDLVTRTIDERGIADAVVWGNGEAVLREMRALGEPVALDVWLRERLSAPAPG